MLRAALEGGANGTLLVRSTEGEPYGALERRSVETPFQQHARRFALDEVVVCMVTTRPKGSSAQWLSRAPPSTPRQLLACNVASGSSFGTGRDCNASFQPERR